MWQVIFHHVQQVSKKLSFAKAKVALRVGADALSFAVPEGHKSQLCSYKMSVSNIETFESLPSLESNVAFDEVQALVYVAGYVTKKDDPEIDSFHTFFYYEKFGCYTQSMNRGGLNLPNDVACQWCIFCYLLFLVVKRNVCRQSLSDMFQFVSD